MNQPLRDLIAANPDTTPEQGEALCAADPRTAAPIPLDDLRALLTGAGVLGQLLLASLAGNAQAATAYAYLSSSNRTIRSDLPQYAAQLDDMIVGLTPLGLTDDLKAAVIALGGGYLFRGTTAQQWSDEVAAASRDDAWSALNYARFAADAARSAKLNWLLAHPDADLPVNPADPADLGPLDAFTIPAT